jgi:hypothetical protein
VIDKKFFEWEFSGIENVIEEARLDNASRLKMNAQGIGNHHSSTVYVFNGKNGLPPR